MSAPADPPVVALLPYLPCSKRIGFGQWELIPIKHLTDDDAQSPWVRESTEGLFRLYKTRSTRIALGAVVRPVDGKVGDPLEPGDLGSVRRPVVAALLDGNPSQVDAAEDPNAGHSVATSENALIYGHRLNPDGFVAVQYGEMVTALVGGLKIGDENSVIHAPVELHSPLLARDPDSVYLAALHAELAKDDDGARQLARAIDWLDLGWRNSTSVTQDMRIFALKCGFEVLFGEESDMTLLRRRLSDLLDPAETPTAPHEWTNLAGTKTYSEEMTPLAWWFLNFAFLRNSITHGAGVAPEEYEWEGVAHVWHAEWTLRRAIKQIVANAGHPEVLLDPFTRAIQAAAIQLAADLDADPEPESAG